MEQIFTFVSVDTFKTYAVDNGPPEAPDITTEPMFFTGSVAGGAAGAITQPVDVKLADEYDYYVLEARVSANFLDDASAAAAIGATAYIPLAEAAHIGFTLNSDGRNRPALFRGPGGTGAGVLPFEQAMTRKGGKPFTFPAPIPFSGKERVQCVVSFIGAYNPAAIAAQLDFQISLTAVLVKKGALSAWSAYLQQFRGQQR